MYQQWFPLLSTVNSTAQILFLSCDNIISAETMAIMAGYRVTTKFRWKLEHKLAFEVPITAAQREALKQWHKHCLTWSKRQHMEVRKYYKTTGLYLTLRYWG